MSNHNPNSTFNCGWAIPGSGGSTTLDEPCRHPVDLRTNYLERGKRWQRCCICGAVRFGCGAWDRERSLLEVERNSDDQ